MRHRGQVVSREQILSAVWGYEHDPATNVVDVYVGYLRRKLGRPGRPGADHHRALASATASAAPAERHGRMRHGSALRAARPALAAGGLGRAGDARSASAITFVAVYRGTGTQLRRQIDREIARRRSASWRTASRCRRAHAPRELAQPPTRYVRGQPFSASSTLLFALVPGARHEHQPPRAVRAERARQRRDARRAGSRRTGSRAQLLQRARRLLDAAAPRRRRPAPAQAHGARCRGGRRVTVGVGRAAGGASRTPSAASRARSSSPALLALAGALLASYLIGTRVSRPLRRMAAVAARVDAGDLHPRIHDVERRGATRCRCWPTPSTTCSTASTDAFAGQRAFVADASHELRTPLTVIRGQLEVLAAQARPSARGGAPRGAPRAGRDRAHHPPGRRPAAARARPSRPSSCASSAIDLRRATWRELWDGMTPARRPPLRARRRCPRARCAPTPTGSRRRCAT